MFFVVDKPRLQRLIAITRDDRTPSLLFHRGPYYRIEAANDRLRLTGRQVEADFPAQVLEPGVLFLRVTLFRRALQAVTGQTNIAIQVNADGVLIDDVRLPLETNDMLLYLDPTRAPSRHPGEVDDDPRPGAFDGANSPTSWGPLFEANGLWPDVLAELKAKEA